ncbi:hypothetical protein FQN54_002284 [Arachnomyces sp. PD_36]|nr:hypothetical protein FQN54_002284 [Arachnomyces sp. PD_36]
MKDVADRLPSRNTDRLQAGFLKSSAKITIHPKALKRAPGKNTGTNISRNASQSVRSDSPGSHSLSRTGSPFATGTGSVSPRAANATWICPICSFSNPIPQGFDPSTANASTQLPPCQTCGIKPPFTTVLKAAIAAASNRGAADTPSNIQPTQDRDNLPDNTDRSRLDPPTTAKDSSVACPRCTFVNHPSLRECEICGASLASSDYTRTQIPDGGSDRSESPAPLRSMNLENNETCEVKISFRGGGEKVFLERLKGALIQRKWLLQDAPPVPKPPDMMSDPLTSASGTETSNAMSSGPVAGIAGLERRGFETRKNNEYVLGNAFEDLEALMASAKEVIALAETFATESKTGNDGDVAEASAVLSQSAAALGMVTTKDMLGSGSENLYVTELSRNVAEYLTDDRKGVLQREGGIMSLIDLWAVFNRSRNGVELVSPSDFVRAAELWEKLKLPVRLRRFKSGLLVVQRYDWSDEKTIRELQTWFQELHTEPPDTEVSWDWQTFGRGVTGQEAAQRFGWSVGVATEELEMAEDRGILCREEGIEGLKFWINHISGDADDEREEDILENSLSGLVI